MRHTDDGWVMGGVLAMHLMAGAFAGVVAGELIGGHKGGSMGALVGGLVGLIDGLRVGVWYRMAKKERRGYVWEVSCPDFVVRKHGYRNRGDADCDAREFTKRGCALFAGPEEPKGCPGGLHWAQRVRMEDDDDETTD